MKKTVLEFLAIALGVLLCGPVLAQGAAKKPNILIIWGDDIGQFNVSAYDMGMMGYRTPNIDRIAKEGALFTALRAPLLTNLRMAPFERAEHENAMGYQRWDLEHMFAVTPAVGYVGEWLQSFKDFPPRQKPGSFNVDRVMESITAGSPGRQ